MFDTVLRSVTLGLFLVATPLGQHPAYAESCGCEVSDAREAACDAALLAGHDDDANVELHLPFGVPASIGGGQDPSIHFTEVLLVSDEYVQGYDTELLIPIWTSYTLTGDDALLGRPRVECFREDPRLGDPTENANCDDYEEPLFDQGHLVPSADMGRSETAMVNTYVYSNMCPQFGGFNRGIWAFFEDAVRDWAVEKGEILIVSGVTLDRDGDHMRDTNWTAKRMVSNNGERRVAIPTGYFKVILAQLPDGRIEHLAILLPHTKDRKKKAPSIQELLARQVTIDEIEERSGLDLFADLPDLSEDLLEADVTDGVWQF